MMVVVPMTMMMLAFLLCCYFVSFCFISMVVTNDARRPTQHEERHQLRAMLRYQLLKDDVMCDDWQNGADDTTDGDDRDLS